MSATEKKRLIEMLRSVDQQISETQGLVVSRQMKGLPVEDAEQTLWTLLALSRAYQRRLAEGKDS